MCGYNLPILLQTTIAKKFKDTKGVIRSRKFAL